MAGLHIKFTNGSNPWVMLNASDREIKNAIRRWKRHYTVVDKEIINEIIYLTLTEKED